VMIAKPSTANGCWRSRRSLRNERVRADPAEDIA
jgi:hypothetical protein